jgi:hypothetical protein
MNSCLRFGINNELMKKLYSQAHMGPEGTPLVSNA